MAERSSLATPKSRPPILKWPSNSHSSTGALLGSPRKERVVFEEPKDEAMAACFLQYCAMCERQITTPSNSLLYCSEACRRKDSNKPLSAAIIMAATTPTSPPPPSSPRPILQPRVPTGLSPETYTPSSSSSRIPIDAHSHKSDLDPTEWKPKSPGILRPIRPNPNRYNSEAFRYLSSFHRSITKDETNDNTTTNIDSFYNGIANTAPAPSLVNTPTPTPSTTAASSWSMSASAGGGYDYNTRPLLPKHNRWYSSSAIGAGGVDLVTPHIPPPPEYVKKAVVVDVSGSGRGGLGTFFGGSVE